MSQKSIIRTASLVIALGCFNSLGCSLLVGPKAPPTTSSKVQVALPSFKSAVQGAETQDRGNVIVQLAPPLFELKPDTQTSCTQQIAIIVHNDQYPYDVNQVTGYVAQPKNIEFKLKIANRTSKVLKLAGTMFKFVVDDQEVPLVRAEDAVKDAILRPNDTKEFLIVGPEWQSLPKQATVGFSAFGVPTELDPAGNVKKTENFDWTFEYQVGSVEKDARVTHTTEYMTAFAATDRCGANIDNGHTDPSPSSRIAQ